jgi:hypothetical protein
MVRQFNLQARGLLVGVGMLAFVGPARADDTIVRHESAAARGAADRSIAIREHAGWNAACEAIAAPVLTLDRPPQHGRVCARVATIVVRTLYDGTADACIGRRVAGLRLEFRADAGFSGADRLRYVARYPSVRRAIDVAVTVTGEGTTGAAAQPVASEPALPRQQAGPVPLCAEAVF